MKRLINVSMILVLILGFLPSTSAVAEVIPLWEQMPNGALGTVYSSPTSIMADDFYLPAASSIGQIEFWSDLQGPVEINYDIYQTTTDTNGYEIPGVVLRSGSVTSTGTPEDSEICSNPSNCGYRHNINLDTSLDLAVGHYWFSIYSAESFTWSRANIPIEFQTFAFKTVGTWKGQYTTYAFAFRLLEPQPTCATSVVVTNVNDSGVGSLRQAIVDVCPGGIINFDSTLSGSTITLISELILDKNLTIDGSELDSKVTISGNNAVRVFTVVSGNTVTLESLMITGGSNDNGGGIYNGGTLTINNSSLVSNTGLVGGGIINNGTLSITNSFLSQNTATNGGALSNNGTATLTDCTVSENQAVEAGAGIDQSGGTLTVTDSTISGNTASIRGGGLIVAPGVLADVFGTTFVNNTAGEFGGGGIKNMGTTSVVKSTFTGNTTITTSTWGSAIDNSYSGSQMTLINSTLSGNSGGPSLYNAN